MKTRGLLATLAALLGLVVLVFVLGGLPQAGTGPSPASPATTSSPVAGSPTARTAAPTTAPRAPGVANPSGLPEIKASALPSEARRVLVLIARGGPYPYARDNAVFSNFERILPRKSSGYYREFTVPTPGESDRGARRIVTGAGGEKYYTADHYNSFKFIAEGK
ncbi:ribonuclease domain-containing protein [Arthrobacter sp. Soil763]|uniref:ribonuclease domain-containing protein n=1 Tax=Arthrobacter sp. Soil763 TaxID=1736402 RepID=UPI0006F35603|nr:ribonuclease domain-containing protein [Arthrobacter sp. Soil763]KRE81523.1 ribonuclease [Arthrobacter sp. Soil763]